MRINYTFMAIVAVAISTSLLSCQTKEEAVISDIQDLSERIEANGENYDEEEWEEVCEEYAEIEEQASDCEFTPEQRKQIGKEKAKLYAIMAKEGAKNLGKKVGVFLNESKDYLEGVAEGLKEAYDEGEFDDITEDIKEGMEDLTEELGKYKD